MPSTRGSVRQLLNRYERDTELGGISLSHLPAFLLVHLYERPTFMISPSGFYYLIVGTFNSWQAQAPTVNYIRKTFRVKLNTSCIPGCMPIGGELSNGAKMGSCIVVSGHVTGSRSFWLSILSCVYVCCMWWYVCTYVHNMRHLFEKSWCLYERGILVIL